MSGNLSLPTDLHPVLNSDGTMNRVWYLFFQGLSGAALAPSVPTVAAETKPPASPGLDETEPPQSVGNIIAIAQQVLQSTGLVGPGGGGGNTNTQINNYSITYGDNNAQFDNAGASGPITLTLPPWTPGLRYSFVVIAAQTLNVVTSGSDTISNSSVTVSKVSSAQPFSFISLVTSNSSGGWIVGSQSGNWTYG